MTRLMIVCSAVLAAFLLNGCAGVTSARDAGATAAAVTAVNAAPANAPTSAPAPGTTWYVRNDGGSRYDATINPTGQCNGRSDAAYPGTGVNRACAFGDFRYLWANDSAAGSWSISGGDTVIVRGGPYRIGAVDSSGRPFNGYTHGGLGQDNQYNPTIPIGTSGQHTRILGENYANCTGNNKTQLFGGFTLNWILDLRGTSYVDVECLEITDHAQCVKLGSPAQPSFCNSSTPPFDDYAVDGFRTDQNTHDVLLQDVNIHGLVNNGILGPIGGAITATRVRIAFNGGAGWNFDDGSNTQNVNGQINAINLTVEWNGCDEEYPIVDAIPALYCYDDSNGGYGDGMASQDSPLNLNCTQCIFRYNTQDGLDFLHATGGAILVTQSSSYSNMGQQFKIGAATSSTLIDSFSLGDCRRMSASITGAPTTFNAHLSDFCRASGDQNTFQMVSGSSLTLQHDTFVGYGATFFDIGCRNTSCGTNPIPGITLEDNVVLGYINPLYNSAQAPGAFYFGSLLSASNLIARDHNLYSGARNSGCPSTGYTGEICADPLFVGEPTFVNEMSLDNFNFNLTLGSPARGTGIPLPGFMVDYAGNAYSNPPSIGAHEYTP